MSKITNDGLTRSGTGCFITVPIMANGRQRLQVCSHTLECFSRQVTSHKQMGTYISRFTDLNVLRPNKLDDLSDRHRQKCITFIVSRVYLTNIYSSLIKPDGDILKDQ